MPIRCPDQWMSYAGHCYIIHRDPKIWKDALTSCRKEDGDLASIHNVEEYSFVISQLGYREYFFTIAYVFVYAVKIKSIDNVIPINKRRRLFLKNCPDHRV